MGSALAGSKCRQGDELPHNGPSSASLLSAYAKSSAYDVVRIILLTFSTDRQSRRHYIFMSYLRVSAVLSSIHDVVSPSFC